MNNKKKIEVDYSLIYNINNQMADVECMLKGMQLALSIFQTNENQFNYNVTAVEDVANAFSKILQNKKEIQDLVNKARD